MAESPGSERRGAAVRVVLAVVVAFVGALTLGNAPTVFWGYGLSAFALFLVAFTLPPREALLAYALGTAAGVALDLRAESLFVFVAAGAVVVRALQLVLFVRLRPRVGLPAAALYALLLGVFAAIAVGLATYGGEGLMPAYAAFDAVYLVPAYLVHRLASSSLPPPVRAFGIASVVGGTSGAFLASSAFFLPGPFALSMVLVLAGYLVPRAMAHPPAAVPRWGFVAATLAVVVVLLGAFAGTIPAAGYAARAAFYPLYPDSLAAGQWIAGGGGACRSGDLRGGGTEANGTWGAARLRVLATCLTVTGTIEAVEPTSGPAVDGDYGIDLRLDPAYTYVLSVGNAVLESGLLHVEVVPSDQAAVLPAGGLVPGQHLQITGAWVLDTDHGWGSEIHPAWSVIVLPP